VTDPDFDFQKNHSLLTLESEDLLANKKSFNVFAIMMVIFRDCANSYLIHSVPSSLFAWNYLKCHIFAIVFCGFTRQVRDTAVGKLVPLCSSGFPHSVYRQPEIQLPGIAQYLSPIR
jgi:hypothetical protein